MPNLRDLKKRLKSVQATGQLAGAMRTVSAAKYSRLGKQHTVYREYAEACSVVTEALPSLMDNCFPPLHPEAPALYVLPASNRGLCGGYNSELFNFFRQALGENVARNFLVLPCGKPAVSFVRENGYPLDREFLLPDIPTFADCQPLMNHIRELYRTGVVSSVDFFYQKHINMLTQQPTRVRVLGQEPRDTESGSDSFLYLPSREQVEKSASLTILNARLYALLLETATGSQAATLLAMRSAYDNAEDSAAELSLHISRIRQAAVTNSVIEISSEALREGE